MTFIYTVIFYTVYRKENEIKIHSSYRNLEDAKKFLDSFPTNPFIQKDMSFEFSGEVIERRMCGLRDPEEYDATYQEKSYPFSKMSWTPEVAIIKNKLI